LPQEHTELPEIKSFHIKLLCCLFTYYQFFPNFYNQQRVINILFSTHERLDIEYTRMPSPVYRYVISLAVSLPTRSPGVFINVSARGHRALNNQIFWCGKF